MQKPLTSRQQQVLLLLAQGLTEEQMASQLGLSRKTVEFHKAKLRKKVGLHSVAELTRYAIARGIVPS